MLQNDRKIQHEGVISEITQYAYFVKIAQLPGCEGCHAKAQCQISDKKEKIIEVPLSEGNYSVGQAVIIMASSSCGLLAVWYAFVIPLMLVIGVLAIALYQWHSESLAVLCSLIILAGYLGLLFVFRDKLKKKFVFRLTHKLN